MRKYFGLLFILFSPASFAFSQNDLVTLLQKPENIQGEFVQQRFLKSLPKPITTSGQFVLRQNHGLLWQMQKPFATNVRVKKEGIMQWDGKQWVANQRVGQSQQISLFLGLLSGDISTLKSQFSLNLTGDEKAWKLQLTPDSLLMKQIFTQIAIEGDQVVKSIELYEKQGDRTHIQLQKIRQNQPLATFAKAALE